MTDAKWPDVWDAERIIVKDRFRGDVGDLSALCESIKTLGLLHPLVVTPEGRLIAGLRRFEACKHLGWSMVPVNVAHTLDDAALMLQAERDENTCRKDMTPGELYALGKAIEELERPKARERQGGSGRFGEDGSGSTEPKPQTNPTAKAVGAGLGVSAPTWKRLKHVGEKAEAGDPAASQVLDEMDRGERTITGGYKALRSPENDALSPPKRRRSQDFVLALNSLEGGVEALVAWDLRQLSDEERKLGEQFLTRSIRSLSKFRKQIKEEPNG